MSKLAQPARNYILTYNNYPDDLTIFNEWCIENCDYALYGKEVAPTTGTPHLQGYFQLKKKERISGLSKKLPGVHLMVAKGGYDSNLAYCSKEGEIWETGTPSLTGKRKGLSEACDLVVQKRSLSSIANECPEVYARYYRGLEALSSAISTTRNFKTEVFWYYGPTGTGKSRRAFDLEPDAYWKPSTTKWWNGYEQHDAVIIDDYRRDFCTFAELLRLFDRYPYSVETKGGTRSFISKRIYITSPKSPEETWEGRTAEDLEQLLRRIDHTEHFSDFFLKK